LRLRRAHQLTISTWCASAASISWALVKFCSSAIISACADLDVTATHDQLSGSLSQSSIYAELIIRFGNCGLSVPALTFRPSANFALANDFASCSVWKVSASLACVRVPFVSPFGWNETYLRSLELLDDGLKRVRFRQVHQFAVGLHGPQAGRLIVLAMMRIQSW
jgi:hypothetical protein